MVLLPLPFISDSPLCPVMAVKRVIPGVVLLPLPFISDSPLCPVTAVKRVIPGVVLLPLPFIPDSPQFALLQQGLVHFTCQASPDSQAFAFLHSPDFNYPMFLKKVKIMLAIPSVGEGPPLPFIPVFPLNLLKCLGTGIGCCVTLPYGPSCH